WKQRFGLEPSALGRTIKVKSTSFEIIGVAPPRFLGETVGAVPDAWVPITTQDTIYPGRDMLRPSPDGQLNQFLWLQVIGRRKPGISNAQASASLNLTFERFVESFAGPGLPEAQRREILGQRLKVQSAARGASTLQSAFGLPLKFLMALVALVLLISCTNVANLLLARGAARQREFVMRLAIGADRGRLICQLLTESLLIASLGAVAGILLASWAESVLLRMVEGISTGPASIRLNLTPDLRVLAFTLLLTVLTALLFGLFPSLHATSLDLATRMKSGASGPSGESAVRRFPLSKALVVAQVTFSVVLLVAAGLFVHSLSKLTRADLGYNRENLLLFRVNPTVGGYKGPAIARLYEDLLARISALPGLRGVTVSR
ncbi:MAG: FtsX-like permease family protein, partial [Acidobacteria bacterium Pan2503]|nr:FtsX-like permease family protein [Candidatus Acidoferrum panamensis]